MCPAMMNDKRKDKKRIVSFTGDRCKRKRFRCFRIDDDKQQQQQWNRIQIHSFGRQFLILLTSKPIHVNAV